MQKNCDNCIVQGCMRFHTDGTDCSWWVGKDNDTDKICENNKPKNLDYKKMWFKLRETITEKDFPCKREILSHMDSIKKEEINNI